MYLYFSDMPRILQIHTIVRIKRNNMLPLNFVSNFTIQVFTKLYIPVLQKSVIHCNKTETVHKLIFCKVVVITHEMLDTPCSEVARRLLATHSICHYARSS
jgi:hypothetical protein